MAKNFYTEDFVKDNTHPIPDRLNFKNITGEVFGLVQVISWAGIKIYGNWKSPRNVWWCKCACGEKGYFLVDRPSLEKGLTTSCGCNYKNNGYKNLLDKNSAQNQLDSRYELLKFEGKVKPCVVKCSICEDTIEVQSFYSLQQQRLVCSCKESEKDADVKERLEHFGFKFIKRIDSSRVEMSCMSCDVNTSRILNSIKECCPCKYVGEGIKTPSAVYLLADRNNKGIYKIGKGNEPVSRASIIQKSSQFAGYDHDFYIYGKKWFASEQVAYHVESLYHQFFKDKSLYGFKSGRDRQVKEFDGACEVFRLTRQDFIDFNVKFKKHIDFLQTEDIPYVVDKPFVEGRNILFKKDDSVSMWFPSNLQLLKYLGVDKHKLNNSTVKEQVHKLYEKDFKIWYKKYVEEGLLNIDGIFYDNLVDFYSQHLHFSCVSLSLFKDRVLNKKIDPLDAISKPIERNYTNIYKDVDGTEVTCKFLYRKYSPVVAFQTFKKKLLEGMCPKEASKLVPENASTKVFLIGGKYYSNIQLYALLKPLSTKQSFYNRLDRDWCPLIAACVSKISGRSPKNANLEDYISDSEKYNSLKLKMGVK